MADSPSMDKFPNLQVLKSCEYSEVITSLQSKHFARFIISFFIKSTQQNLSDFLVFQPIHIAIICNLFSSILFPPAHKRKQHLKCDLVQIFEQKNKIFLFL